MPKEKENFDRENEALIEAFKKKKEAMEDRGEHAERLLKSYLKQGLGVMGSDKRKTVAKDIIRASKDTPSKFRGGEFGNALIKDDPDPTGFEPRPWEDDSD